jgi:uncharacterized Rossmann fold enzyme
LRAIAVVALTAWWPKYLAIVTRFGYSVEEDQHAANMLSQMIADHATPVSRILSIVKSKNVVVCGAGPSLPRNLQAAMRTDLLVGSVLIAADGATTALVNRHLQPDLIVSDLDGKLPDIVRAQRKGAVVVVHAHGDNIPLLKRHVPQLLQSDLRTNGVLGSTQARPCPGVVNFGGFTDGDRCVFLAEEYGARAIALLGMDFGDVVGRYSKPTLSRDSPASSVKREKLLVAKELLEWLATTSRSQLVNLTGGVTSIQGIPDQPITRSVWNANAD